MASSDFTGSAGTRAAKSKPQSQNLTAELADICTRMEDIRDVLTSAVDSLRGQNIRIDADIASALERRAFQPLTEINERLQTLSA
jgi:hypothetical protein